MMELLCRAMQLQWNLKAPGLNHFLGLRVDLMDNLPLPVSLSIYLLCSFRLCDVCLCVRNTLTYYALAECVVAKVTVTWQGLSQYWNVCYLEVSIFVACLFFG